MHIGRVCCYRMVLFRIFASFLLNLIKCLIETFRILCKRNSSSWSHSECLAAQQHPYDAKCSFTISSLGLFFFVFFGFCFCFFVEFFLKRQFYPRNITCLQCIALSIYNKNLQTKNYCASFVAVHVGIWLLFHKLIEKSLAPSETTSNFCNM